MIWAIRKPFESCYFQYLIAKFINDLFYIVSLTVLPSAAHIHCITYSASLRHLPKTNSATVERAVC